jgi:hypothetical protein
MMMVPMMMSADGTGATQPVPMMNPYMPQAAMAPAYCPMPAHPMVAPVAAAPATAATTSAQVPVQVPAAPPAAAPLSTPGRQQEASMLGAAQGQSSHQPQAQYHQTYPYMMPAPMAGGGYMMPMPGHHMAVSPGQHMAMMAHPQSMQMVLQQQHQESQNGRQEQKDSSPVLNGGSGNLAHCA